MIYQKILSLLAVPVLAISLSGCPSEIEPNEPWGGYSAYTPVLMSRTQLEGSIRAEANKAVTNPAKVFLDGNRIYMTEQYKGVYVIDNTDPAHPTQLGFVAVPGLNDAVVKNGILIVDNATDILGIDIANPLQPNVLWRRRNALPPMPPPDNLPSRPVTGTPGSIVVEWVIQ